MSASNKCRRLHFFAFALLIANAALTLAIVIIQKDGKSETIEAAKEPQWKCADDESVRFLLFEQDRRILARDFAAKSEQVLEMQNIVDVFEKTTVSGSPSTAEEICNRLDEYDAFYRQLRFALFNLGLFYRPVEDFGLTAEEIK